MSKKLRLQKGLDDLAAALRQWLGAIENKDRIVTVHQRLKAVAELARSSGATELSTHALRIERPLAALIDRPGQSPQSAVQTAGALKELLAKNTPPSPSSAIARRPYAAPAKDSTVAPIYIVNPNALLAEDIAMQLRCFGYTVEVLNHIDRVAPAVAACTPIALILDFEYREDMLAKVAQLARQRDAAKLQYPIAVISTRGHFKARLSVARIGVDCYFTKPVDVGVLSDRLDAVIFSREAHPFRILIVSDDPARAQQYNTALRQATMDTRLLQTPSEIFEAFDEYRPELVIMDVDLPDCSGVDMTRLIRQRDIYVDVPIVFLSQNDSFENRLETMRAGADDFFIRPISPEHFVSSVASRAERYRALRTLFMRDSLTGLLNHCAIKEALGREVANGRLSDTPVTLAMIDIDFFKRVNDTYGHPVGDQVIRTLSRLLQRRLRRGDAVGRYGGEEFAVILPRTSATLGIGVLDRIRDAFAQLRHHSDEQDFTASFSAGVVDSGAFETPEDLIRAADVALYKAKHKGRNRIEMGNPGPAKAVSGQ